MSITVKLVTNQFGNLGGKLAGQVRAAVSDTAHAIEADAKQRAPVDTGALRSSISTQVISDTEAHVNVAADYGAYVEYGHRAGGSFVAAQPFLTPAAEAQRAPFEARLKKVLG